MISKKIQNPDDVSEYLKDGYVLVADDMPNMCKTIRSMLKSLGIKWIIDAPDGDVALNILKNKDHIKLQNIINEEYRKCLFALLDWHMPRMPGIEVAMEIRADPRIENIPILMVTAESGKDQIVQAAAEAGVNGFILKPFTTGDLEKKFQKILKARANPPEHVKLINATEKYLKQGRLDEGLATINKAALLSSQGLARINVLKGEVLKEKGEYEEANCCYAQAMVSNPGYLKTYAASADLCLRTGKKDQALSLLEKAAEISPLNAARHTAIGEIYLENGEQDKAQRAFDVAFQQDPGKAKDIAEAFLKEGKDDKAEEYFRKCLPTEIRRLGFKEKDEYVHTTNRLGIALRRQGKLKEAVVAYKNARKIAPDNEAIYFNLGRAYVVLWKKESDSIHFEKAKKCFRKAIELDPDFTEAKKELEKLAHSHS